MFTSIVSPLLYPVPPSDFSYSNVLLTLLLYLKAPEPPPPKPPDGNSPYLKPSAKLIFSFPLLFHLVAPPPPPQ